MGVKSTKNTQGGLLVTLILKKVLLYAIIIHKLMMGLPQILNKGAHILIERKFTGISKYHIITLRT